MKYIDFDSDNASHHRVNEFYFRKKWQNGPVMQKTEMK